jgi:hypothetical protein
MLSIGDYVSKVATYQYDGEYKRSKECVLTRIMLTVMYISIRKYETRSCKHVFRSVRRNYCTTEIRNSSLSILNVIAAVTNFSYVRSAGIKLKFKYDIYIYIYIYILEL